MIDQFESNFEEGVFFDEYQFDGLNTGPSDYQQDMVENECRNNIAIQELNEETLIEKKINEIEPKTNNKEKENSNYEKKIIVENGINQEEIISLPNNKETVILIYEADNGLNKEKQFTKQKRTRKNKESNDISRGDNIFKQVKIHTIQFVVNTMNDLLKGKINNFYKFKNTVSDEIKNKVEKKFNLEILEITFKEILNYKNNTSNKEVLNQFEALFEENKNDKDLINIDKMLNMKFKDLVKMYGMSVDSFYKEYRFYNERLLINLDDNKIRNKNLIKDLIQFGVDNYFHKKKGRVSKKK